MARPKDLDGSNYDEDKVSELYTTLLTDLVVDKEENEELSAFFSTDNAPPKEKLIFTRASAFRIGCDFLGDDKDTNIKLLRCINVIVHNFEMSCLE